MPGIAGIVSKSRRDAYQRVHAAMVAVMEHEDLYTCGPYTEDRLNIRLGWVAFV